MARLRYALPGRWRTVLFSLVVLSGLFPGGGPAVASGGHPLDPLSEAEIALAAEVIAGSGRTDASTRAAMITLQEPNKAYVKRWRTGKPLQRKAFAVLRSGGETIEAVVDLETRQLESWFVVPGAQPAIQSTEWARAQRLIKQDSRWQAAMLKRGYSEFDQIFCDSLSAGYFGPGPLDGRRLIRMPCYDVAGATSHVYARPIEGVIATVDLDRGQVVDVTDTGVVPVPEAKHGFDEASIDKLDAAMKPVRNMAPQGWNFTLDGRMLKWQGWSMHLGFDHRFGPGLQIAFYYRRPLGQ